MNSKSEKHQITTKICTSMLSATLLFSASTTPIRNPEVRPSINIKHKSFDEQDDSFGYTTMISDNNIFKRTSLRFNENNSSQEDATMKKRSVYFEAYTAPINPVITIVANSKKELEEMFPAQDTHYEKYLDEFEELFASPSRKR